MIGLIENMSVYTCRCCGDKVYLFGENKGQGLARMMDIPFLGSIPLDQDFSEAADTGVPIVELNAESITAKAFVEIARNVSSQLPPKEMEEAPVMESKPCPGSSHGHGHDHDHEGHGHHHH